MSLFIHAKDRLFVARAPFTDAPMDIGLMSPFCKTPDLSADGKKLAYVSNVGQDFVLLVGDAAKRPTFSGWRPLATTQPCCGRQLGNP
jgi:hypothetical protein